MADRKMQQQQFAKTETFLVLLHQAQSIECQ